MGLMGSAVQLVSSSQIGSNKPYKRSLGWALESAMHVSLFIRVQTPPTFADCVKQGPCFGSSSLFMAAMPNNKIMPRGVVTSFSCPGRVMSRVLLLPQGFNVATFARRNASQG